MPARTRRIPERDVRVGFIGVFSWFTIGTDLNLLGNFATPIPDMHLQLGPQEHLGTVLMAGAFSLRQIELVNPMNTGDDAK